MNVLVVTPHHDDEIIGCGGTIINRHKKGDRVWVVYVTAGWSGIPEIKSREDAIRIREKEARNACKILGVEKTIFMREEDRNISADGKIIQKLIKIIRKIKPNLIYAPHQGEKDKEHRIAYELTKEASWLASSSYLPDLGSPVKSIELIYLYEVWTPMENFLIKENITQEIDLKLKALSEYKSQLKYLNLADAIKGLNMYRGSMASTTKKFAEVFQVEKP